MTDKEYIEKVMNIQSPIGLLNEMFDGEGRLYYKDFREAFEKRVAELLAERKNVNGYAEPWKTANIHINKGTGEIHCDGDEETIKFIKEQMHANGKIHDTLNSIDALDNLSLAEKTASDTDIVSYVKVLVADWREKRHEILKTLCVVCGRHGGLIGSTLIHNICLENISKGNKRIFLVGSVVRLKSELLDNPAGAFGVCYDTYQIGSRQGSSFIFENGKNDGFSPDEQNEFLRLVGQSSEIAQYIFTNAVQLNADFRTVNSQFKKTFEYMRKVLP